MQNIQLYRIFCRAILVSGLRSDQCRAAPGPMVCPGQDTGTDRQLVLLSSLSLLKLCSKVPLQDVPIFHGASFSFQRSWKNSSAGMISIPSSVVRRHFSRQTTSLRNRGISSARARRGRSSLLDTCCVAFTSIASESPITKSTSILESERQKLSGSVLRR